MHGLNSRVVETTSLQGGANLENFENFVGVGGGSFIIENFKISWGHLDLNFYLVPPLPFLTFGFLGFSGRGHTLPTLPLNNPAQ
jgi:hypothetical protein